jgi:hypothetical protein
MPKVNVPGVGQVNFPDDMSHDQIVNAIETDVIPQYQVLLNLNHQFEILLKVVVLLKILLILELKVKSLRTQTHNNNLMQIKHVTYKHNNLHNKVNNIRQVLVKILVLQVLHLVLMHLLNKLLKLQHNKLLI